jgi:hypothetical protein
MLDLYGKKRARLCSEPYTGEMVEVSGERRYPNGFVLAH